MVKLEIQDHLGTVHAVMTSCVALLQLSEELLKLKSSMGRSQAAAAPALPEASVLITSLLEWLCFLLDCLFCLFSGQDRGVCLLAEGKRLAGPA